VRLGEHGDARGTGEGDRRESTTSSRRLVLTTGIGTPLEPRTVLRALRGPRGRASLRGVTLHTLRHSAASSLLAAGTHTEVVQEQLGHSSSAITADVDSHVGHAQQREAADRLDQALRW
jgi:integrase